MLSLALAPHLVEPPWSEWERRYPNGLGVSAFSSPAWQRVTRTLVEPEYDLCVLVANDGEKRYSLPIYARPWRFGRVELLCQPTAYYQLPIECERAEPACIEPLVQAAHAPLTSAFRWWLPPWLAGNSSAARRDVDTYVIDVSGQRDADAFMERSVRRRFREYVRSSHRHGVEILATPTSREVDAYYELYQRTYTERQWVGDAFPREFFDAVAHDLGEGGKLVVIRHDGRVVGGGVVLFDHYAVHYFQGVTERDNGEVKPHLVLYDWLIRTACARGLCYVNLGGVNEGNASLVQFKTSWGARAVPVERVDWTIDRSWLRARLRRAVTRGSA